MTAARRLAAAALLSLALPAAALDYRSIAEPAILYDAPSAKGQRLFVIARSTPVEVVVANEGWLRIRDADGTMAWVEKRFVADKRTVMVRSERAQVRAQPDDKAPLVFEAEKDVVLDLLEAAPPGWARVKHRGGQSGYVSFKQVWGL